MVCLKGYKHYVSAAVMLLMGLISSLDGSAAGHVVDFLGAIGIPVTPSTVLMFGGAVVVGLKKVQTWCDCKDTGCEL